MSLPEFSLPTPTIYDSMQYAIGAKVGVDTAVDKWQVDNAHWMIPDNNLWTLDPNAALCIAGGFGWAKHKSDISVNQWAACQCIVPLDFPLGVFPAVRVDPNTNTGYWVCNFGDNDYGDFNLQLIRTKNGVHTMLGWWVIGHGVNEGVIDNVTFGDGFIVMVEVVGTNPVYIRVSHMLPVGVAAGYSYLTQLPNIGIGSSGVPAPVIDGVIVDSSANRITSGGIGLIGGLNINAAGGIFSFQGGELSEVIDSFSFSVDDINLALAIDHVNRAGATGQFSVSDLVLQPRIDNVSLFDPALLGSMRRFKNGQWGQMGTVKQIDGTSSQAVKRFINGRWQ